VRWQVGLRRQLQRLIVSLAVSHQPRSSAAAILTQSVVNVVRPVVVHVSDSPRVAALNDGITEAISQQAVFRPCHR
jgi:hypothetical protein